MSSELIFLKLGGSLITDKTQANTARRDVIARLAREIAEAREAKGELRLLLGHGSGSFGHFAAKEHGTRDGVSSPAQWRGFVDVWRAARRLHNLVLEALQQADLPVLGFAPSAMALSREGVVSHWNMTPIQRALDAELIPVVYGDVVFDEQQGGGILSTEEVFLQLSRTLRPSKVLLAANEPVYADFPQREETLPEISTTNIAEIRETLSSGKGRDVTGGMLSKVETALEIVAGTQTEAWIFSGEQPGQVKNALLGEPMGTRISG